MSYLQHRGTNPPTSWGAPKTTERWRYRWTNLLSNCCNKSWPSFTTNLYKFHFDPGRRAKYRDMSVVCLPVCLSVRPHISETTRSKFARFLCMLPVVVARSYSGGVVVRYVLPVLCGWRCVLFVPWPSTLNVMTATLKPDPDMSNPTRTQKLIGLSGSKVIVWTHGYIHPTPDRLLHLSP